MRILLLAEGDPETFDSWSGSSRGLLRALRAQGHDVIGADVSETGWQRWAALARSWTPNRHRWTARFHFGRAGFGARSRAAGALVRRHEDDFDVVLQIGATFDALQFTDRPGFVYCDSNARLTARDAPSGEVAALSSSEHDAVVARESTVYRRARTVFAMSEYLRRSFIRDFDLSSNAVQAVFAGANLDLETLPPLPPPRTRSEAPPTVLFVGKQWERKGGPLLLEAFRGVRSAMPDARLVVVGCTPAIDGAAGVEIVGPVAKQSTGGQSRLSAFYQDADVFCMPSQFEPFGVVFVEAMLHGLPCVGSDRCAIPEIVAHEETGWVVPAGDAARLSHTLTAALGSRDRLAMMRERCRERALRLFTWERVAERIATTMSAQADAGELRLAR